MFQACPMSNPLSPPPSSFPLTTIPLHMNILTWFSLL